MTHQIEFQAMGCQMLAALEYPTPRVKSLLARVPGWFETWEACLSRFRPDSELSQVNNQAGTEMLVSNTFWSVLQAAVKAETFSQGLVTPTLLRELVAAGYDRSFTDLVPDQVRHTPSVKQAGRLQTVQLDPQKQTVCLPAGISLDFGGVAKGWAAHQALQGLKPYGPALVDAGGDIAISGLKKNGEPWAVGIQNPLKPGDSLATLLLGRCGVATSGTDHRRWVQNGVQKHHIIDPRSGEPVQTDVLAATVIAPNVLEAEAAAKTALILGSRAGMTWLDAHPTLAGLLVTHRGELIYTPRFQNYLEEV